MADDIPVDNTQYGNIAQIKEDLFELKQAVANMEARVEPLQEYTNTVNRIDQQLMDLKATWAGVVDEVRQQVAALAKKVLEMDGRYATRLGALEQRINTLFGDGGVEAFVEDRIKIALAVIDQRLDKMGKMGQ